MLKVLLKSPVCLHTPHTFIIWPRSTGKSTKCFPSDGENRQLSSDGNSSKGTDKGRSPQLSAMSHVCGASCLPDALSVSVGKCILFEGMAGLVSNTDPLNKPTFNASSLSLDKILIPSELGLCFSLQPLLMPFLEWHVLAMSSHYQSSQRSGSPLQDC